MTTGRFLFTLDAAREWALLADGNQWMVAHARKRRAECYWHPLTFIGGRKATLLRCVRENGIAIDPCALATLQTWPDRFRDWSARDG